MILDDRHDPMGHAIRDFHQAGKAGRLIVSSSLFDDDEMPVSTFFRTPMLMNALERRALSLAVGKVLDVGAGAGCHSLALQANGIQPRAIDISPLSVATMRERGVRQAEVADFFAATDADKVGAGYDTLLLLMNGIGIAGKLDRLPAIFQRFDELLAPGGSVLADSSDLRYVFEDENGELCYEDAGYYGEVDYTMKYGKVRGLRFDWLYVDFDTLRRTANVCGFNVEKVQDGPHYDYLCRIMRQ